MDIYTFYKTKSKAEVRRICDLIGISIIQWRNYANGYARPSVDLAHKLVLASDGQMTFAELLPPSTSMPKLNRFSKKYRAGNSTIAHEK